MASKPASPFVAGRSGEKPELAVQSGWEKVVGVGCGDEGVAMHPGG